MLLQHTTNIQCFMVNQNVLLISQTDTYFRWVWNLNKCISNIKPYNTICTAYETQMSNTIFKMALLYNSYPKPKDSFVFHLFLLRSVLILSSYIHLDLLRYLLLVDLPNNTLKAFLPCPFWLHTLSNSIIMTILRECL